MARNGHRRMIKFLPSLCQNSRVAWKTNGLPQTTGQIAEIRDRPCSDQDAHRLGEESCRSASVGS